MPHFVKEISGPVALLTLNRPNVMNALSGEMATLAVDALRDIEDDDAIKVVVITGAGRAFSAGGDVNKMKRTQSEGIAYDEALKEQFKGHEFARLLHDLQKVTIAAINGPAFGAGLAIAVATDLRIASDAASFGTAFADVGLDGDLGISWSLAKLVGESKAKELMFLPSQISAEEAARIGLVNFVVPSSDFKDETDNLANRLAKGPANVFRFMKKNINAAHAESFTDTLDREATSHVSLFNDPDFKEGVSAFLEKRRPNFK